MPTYTRSPAPPCLARYTPGERGATSAASPNGSHGDYTAREPTPPISTAIGPRMPYQPTNADRAHSRAPPSSEAYGESDWAFLEAHWNVARRAPRLSAVCPGRRHAPGMGGERETMIPARPAPRRSGCSPHRLSTHAIGWVQPTGVNSTERSPTDVPYQTLTCRNHVSAGQHECPDNVDTEEVTGSIPVSPTI
jgi:hypothetical protein